MSREELAGGPAPSGPDGESRGGRPRRDDVVELSPDPSTESPPGRTADLSALRRHPRAAGAALATLVLAALLGAVVRGAWDERSRLRADARAVHLYAWPTSVDTAGTPDRTLTAVRVELLNAGRTRVVVSGAAVDGMPALRPDPVRLELPAGGRGSFRLEAAVPCATDAPRGQLRLRVDPEGGPPLTVTAVTVPTDLSWQDVFSRGGCTGGGAEPAFVAAVVGTPRAVAGRVQVDVRAQAGPQGPVSIDDVGLDVQQGSSTSPELPLRLAAGSGAVVRLVVDPPACGTEGLPAQIASAVHVRWAPTGGPEQDSYVDGGPALLTAAVHAQDQACRR
ncbi:MAG TPA: hypothetical protein VFS29_02650 [Motilibacteraceae bacterium]|nr:hypothetical protein [Motilibacteraceae bacterium]